VETLVWNKRTGRLVSGHQRLGILDELEGGSDYKLQVAAIDVDEREEKRLNVFLNNPEAMGEFDIDGLEDLVADIGADGLGFDNITVKEMFEIGDNDNPFNTEPPEVEQTAERLDKIKQLRKETRKNWQEKSTAEFVVVAVFPTKAEATAFLADNGFDPDDRYIDGRVLAGMIADAAQEG